MLKRLFIVVSVLWAAFVFWDTYRNTNGFGEAEAIFALSVPAALLIMYLAGRFVRSGTLHRH